MKMLYKIVIIVIILFVTISLVYYAKNSIKDGDDMVNRLTKYENLKSIEYSVSGDMEGRYLYLELQHFDDYDLLIKKEQISHNQELTYEEYQLSNNTLEQFKKELVKYKYENWKNLKRSDEVIDDAGIAKITFNFGKERYLIDEYVDLPKTEEDLFKKIYDFLNNKIEKENFYEKNK